MPDVNIVIISGRDVDDLKQKVTILTVELFSRRRYFNTGLLPFDLKLYYRILVCITPHFLLKGLT